MTQSDTDRRPQETKIVRADLTLPLHQDAVVFLMNEYAADPMGDGRHLSPDVRERLIDALRDHPTTLIFLAFEDQTPVGIVTCFRGFSTFAAKPLINISDFYVDPQKRGLGIGRRLLSAVQSEAIATDCCKLTLEVQENNRNARKIYSAFGFSQSVYVEAAGGSLALSKPLNN